jgi:PqqA peptide cyclase
LKMLPYGRIRATRSRSPAFEAFRGTGWMREPCVSCPRKMVDFGGCRCQAFALTGDAQNTDPVCTLSPMNRIVQRAVDPIGNPGSVLVGRRFEANPIA